MVQDQEDNKILLSECYNHYIFFVQVLLYLRYVTNMAVERCVLLAVWSALLPSFCQPSARASLWWWSHMDLLEVGDIRNNLIAPTSRPIGRSIGRLTNWLRVNKILVCNSIIYYILKCNQQKRWINH